MNLGVRSNRFELSTHSLLNSLVFFFILPVWEAWCVILIVFVNHLSPRKYLFSRHFVSLITAGRRPNLHVFLNTSATKKQRCHVHWPWKTMCHIPGRSSHIPFAWETFSTGGRDTQSDSRADIGHIWGRQERHTLVHIGPDRERDYRDSWYYTQACGLFKNLE